MKIKAIALMCAGVFMVVACVTAAPEPAVPSEAPVEEMPNQEDVMNCPPTPEPTDAECPTAAPVQMPEVGLRRTTVSSSNLTLRAGPTIAHPALGSFPLGTEVTILGKAPGGSWSVVSAPAGHLGWMYSIYLDISLTDPMDDVAVVEPTDSWIIEGRVLDDTGTPVESIGVSLALGGLTDYPDYSDEQGRFFLFAPSSQPGPWTVSIKGVGCLSRLVDEDCQLNGYILRNPSQVYQAGQSQDLTFVYEATTMQLTGRVEDIAGNPYGGAGVFATRSDGAYVTATANSDGLFTIPITPGNWRLMATRGQSITVSVTESGYGQELILVGSPN